LSISQGSASELDTLIEISFATNLGNIKSLNKIQENTEQVSKLLQGLIRNLKT